MKVSIQNDGLVVNGKPLAEGEWSDSEVQVVRTLVQESISVGNEDFGDVFAADREVNISGSDLSFQIDMGGLIDIFIWYEMGPEVCGTLKGLLARYP